MKYAVFTLMVLAGLMARAPRVSAQDAAPRAMSAIDILEALVSPDAALRDRGATEVKSMSDATAKDLGGEILRVGVREAQAALNAMAVGDTTPAAIAAFGGLDSKQKEVRTAALDALVAMSPGHVAEAGSKHITADRRETLHKMISESDYVKLLCEGVEQDDKGNMKTPVRNALGLVILLDRVFGVKAVSLLLKRVSGLMLGEKAADDKKMTDTERATGERRRRGALKWCEAVWIEDPAIVFNYSPIAPYADREKAVAHLDRKLDGMETEELTYGDKTFKGMRYGDYLRKVMRGSDVTGNKAAAYLRLRWWSGEDAVISGDGYAEAVEAFSKLRMRQKHPLLAKLDAWWIKYRSNTDRE